MPLRTPIPPPVDEPLRPGVREKDRAAGAGDTGTGGPRAHRPVGKGRTGPPDGALTAFAARLLRFLWLEPYGVLLEAVGDAAPTLSHVTPVGSGPEFTKWTRDVLLTTQVSGTVVVIALLYVWRLKQRNSCIQGTQGSEYRLMTIALMLGNKYLDDNTYTNQSWADVTTLAVRELLVMEIEFITNMQYDLHVTDAQWQEWLRNLQSFSQYLYKVHGPIFEGHGSPSSTECEECCWLPPLQDANCYPVATVSPVTDHMLTPDSSQTLQRLVTSGLSTGLSTPSPLLKSDDARSVRKRGNLEAQSGDAMAIPDDASSGRSSSINVGRAFGGEGRDATESSSKRRMAATAGGLTMASPASSTTMESTSPLSSHLYRTLPPLGPPMPPLLRQTSDVVAPGASSSVFDEAAAHKPLPPCTMLKPAPFDLFVDRMRSLSPPTHVNACAPEDMRFMMAAAPPYKPYEVQHVTGKAGGRYRGAFNPPPSFINMGTCYHQLEHRGSIQAPHVVFESRIVLPPPPPQHPPPHGTALPPGTSSGSQGLASSTNP